MQAEHTFVAGAGEETAGVVLKVGAGFAGSCCEADRCAVFEVRADADIAGETAKASQLKTIRNFCKVGERSRSLMGIVAEIIALTGG
jgi:hypothetical protein